MPSLPPFSADSGDGDGTAAGSAAAAAAPSCPACGANDFVYEPLAFADICSGCGYLREQGARPNTSSVASAAVANSGLLSLDAEDAGHFWQSEGGYSASGSAFRQHRVDNVVGADQTRALGTGMLVSRHGRVLHTSLASRAMRQVEAADDETPEDALRRERAHRDEVEAQREWQQLPELEKMMRALLHHFRASHLFEHARATFRQARTLVRLRADELAQREEALTQELGFVRDGAYDEAEGDEVQGAIARALELGVGAAKPLLSKRTATFRWGLMATCMALAVVWAVLRERGLPVLLEEVLAASPHHSPRHLRLVMEQLTSLRSLFRRRTRLLTFEDAQIADARPMLPRILDFLQDLLGFSDPGRSGSARGSPSEVSSYDARPEAAVAPVHVRTLAAYLHSRDRPRLDFALWRRAALSLADLCADEGMSDLAGSTGWRRWPLPRAWAIVFKALEAVAREPLPPPAALALVALMHDAKLELFPDADETYEEDEAQALTLGKQKGGPTDLEKPLPVLPPPPPGGTLLERLERLKTLRNSVVDVSNGAIRRLLDERVRRLAWFDGALGGVAVARARKLGAEAASRARRLADGETRRDDERGGTAAGTDAGNGPATHGSGKAAAASPLADLRVRESARRSRAKGAEPSGGVGGVGGAVQPARLRRRERDEELLLPRSTLMRYALDAIEVGAAELELARAARRDEAACGGGPASAPATSSYGQAWDAARARRLLEVMQVDRFRARFHADGQLRVASAASSSARERPAAAARPPLAGHATVDRAVRTRARPAVAARGSAVGAAAGRAEQQADGVVGAAGLGGGGGWEYEGEGEEAQATLDALEAAEERGLRGDAGGDDAGRGGAAAAFELMKLHAAYLALRGEWVADGAGAGEGGEGRRGAADAASWGGLGSLSEGVRARLARADDEGDEEDDDDEPGVGGDAGATPGDGTPSRGARAADDDVWGAVDSRLFARGEMASYLRGEEERRAVWRLRGEEWGEAERARGVGGHGRVGGVDESDAAAGGGGRGTASDEQRRQRRRRRREEGGGVVDSDDEGGDGVVGDAGTTGPGGTRRAAAKRGRTTNAATTRTPAPRTTRSATVSGAATAAARAATRATTRTKAVGADEVRSVLASLGRRRR